MKSIQSQWNTVLLSRACRFLSVVVNTISWYIRLVVVIVDCTIVEKVYATIKKSHRYFLAARNCVLGISFSYISYGHARALFHVGRETATTWHN